MKLPVMPPVSPMLARLVRELPGEGEVLYEPKWDGFRAIVYRDGDEVILGSRNERPMTRYFPEFVESLRTHLPRRCVVDGEIVIVGDDGGLDFDALFGLYDSEGTLHHAGVATGFTARRSGWSSRRSSSRTGRGR